MTLPKFDPPAEWKQWCVLMDVNRYDPDEGRAWITVNAIGALDARAKVADMYPNAAVLRAEEVVMTI